MNYKKIAEIAHECHVTQQIIGGYYILLGRAGNKFDQDVKDEINNSINRLESEQKALENKLIKLIKG